MHGHMNVKWERQVVPKRPQ